MIRTPFSDFDFSADTAYPTVGGGVLSVAESYETKCQIEMGIHYVDRSGDLPSDILYTRFRIPDRDGYIWESESRFRSRVLVEKMHDLSIPSQVIPFSSADEEALAAFNGSEIIKNVRYSSDDGFYRTIPVRDKIISFPFHYTTMTFDLAYYTDKQVELTRLFVKLRDKSLFVEGDDLGAFYFITYPFVGMNTAFYNSGMCWWQENPIPSPAPFKKTIETYQANRNVKYG